MVRGIGRPVCFLQVDVVAGGPDPHANASGLFGQHLPGKVHVAVADSLGKHAGTVPAFVGLLASLVAGKLHRQDLRFPSPTYSVAVPAGIRGSQEGG